MTEKEKRKSMLLCYAKGTFLCHYRPTPHADFYTTSSKRIQLKRRKNRRQIEAVRSKLVMRRKTKLYNQPEGEWTHWY